MSPINEPRLEARIDLGALRANVVRVQETVGPAQVMAVVKADAYGHGIIPCARAAREAGATWLGTAVPEEALGLRRAGIGGRILVWLCAPGEPWADLIAADVDVSANAPWAIGEIAAAAETVGRTARVHLKADTGLGRAGAQPHDWPDLVEAALKAQASGFVQVVGVWSHFACADEPEHPSVRSQLEAFADALELAERRGVEPEVRHIANSPAGLLIPQSRYDLVRAGIAVYGISPAPRVASTGQLGLRPAMTLAARVALTKRVPAGHGISYGHRYVTGAPANLALIPAGYADGIPRAATNRGPLWLAGRRRTIAGTVAMDQIVVDLGDDEAAPGDEAILFGPGDRGEPTAQDWADVLDTIAYEIVTRIGSRVPRTYPGA